MEFWETTETATGQTVVKLPAELLADYDLGTRGLGIEVNVLERPSVTSTVQHRPLDNSFLITFHEKGKPAQGRVKFKFSARRLNQERVTKRILRKDDWKAPLLVSSYAYDVMGDTLLFDFGFIPPGIDPATLEEGSVDVHTRLAIPVTLMHGLYLNLHNMFKGDPNLVAK